MTFLSSNTHVQQRLVLLGRHYQAVRLLLLLLLLITAAVFSQCR